MFASAINHKLDSYVAWQPDPHALHIDAFTLNWNGKNIYLFPPFQSDGKWDTKDTNVQQLNRHYHLPCMANLAVVPNNPTTNTKNYKFIPTLCDQSGQHLIMTKLCLIPRPSVYIYDSGVRYSGCNTARSALSFLLLRAIQIYERFAPKGPTFA